MCKSDARKTSFKSKTKIQLQKKNFKNLKETDKYY